MHKGRFTFSMFILSIVLMCCFIIFYDYNWRGTVMDPPDVILEEQKQDKIVLRPDSLDNVDIAFIDGATASPTPTPYILLTEVPGKYEAPSPTPMGEEIVEVIEQKEYIRVLSALNVRKGPGTSYDTMGSVTAGAIYERKYETENNWSCIIYKDNVEGYVSSKYVEIVTEKEVLAMIPGYIETDPETGKQLPAFSGRSYCIISAKDGKILLSKDEDARIYPASMTKMLTALVAVDREDVDNEIATCAEALAITKSDSEIASFGVKTGTSYTLENWLNLMLLGSYSDAADTIAYGVADTYSDFVSMMNEKAKKIGMISSHFDNAIGLDATNGFNDIYSTAYDMCLLTRELMNDDVLASIVNKASCEIILANGRISTVQNSNTLITDKRYKSDLFTVIGTKTGYTDDAGYCLAAAATDNYGNMVIIVYTGGTSKTTVAGEVFNMFNFIYKEKEAGLLDF